MVISDTGNPNASAAGLWVGAIQQPATSNAVYDFTKWMKAYQFWVKTDAGGNFTIPNVIAGTNYTLYAFRSRRGGHVPVPSVDRRQRAVDDGHSGDPL